MATVRKLEPKDVPSARPQDEVRATISLVEVGGERFVQIDTYGSLVRQEVGKQSQSLRLSKSAFDQLFELGSKHL